MSRSGVQSSPLAPFVKHSGGGLTIRPLFLWIDNTSDNNRLENRFKSERPDHIYQTRLQLNIIFGWGLFVADYVATEIIWLLSKLEPECSVKVTGGGS